MKKKYLILGISAVLLLVVGAAIYIKVKNSVYNDEYGREVTIMGDTGGLTSPFPVGKSGESDNEIGYKSITMEEAKEIFETAGDYIILDVRRADEFAEGHIPGAINVANEDIGYSQPEELPETDKAIYVYCRSGRRSKEAASKLVTMGYKNVIDCGGISDWTGDIEL